MLWEWGKAALAVGVPAGTASALLTWTLWESFTAEVSLIDITGLAHDGPSTLLLLLWGVSGYASGAVADRHLGLTGLLAMGIAAASAGVALLIGLALHAILAGSLPGLLVGIEVACVIVWLAAAAKRVYVD